MLLNIQRVGIVPRIAVSNCELAYVRAIYRQLNLVNRVPILRVSRNKLIGPGAWLAMVWTKTCIGGPKRR